MADYMPQIVRERDGAEVPIATQEGSSPFSWGTSTAKDCRRPRDRFIPTNVGNAWTPTATRTSMSVHPHVRGERNGPGTFPFLDDGSSPKIWGAFRPSPQRSPPRRFIPTYVGNAACSTPTRQLTSVHPHGRGERNGGNSRFDKL